MDITVIALLLGVLGLFLNRVLPKLGNFLEQVLPIISDSANKRRIKLIKANKQSE